MSTDSGDAVDADDGVTKLLAHPDIVKLHSALESHKAVRAESEEGVRRAAVALIFRAGESGAPELLFIRRADYPADLGRLPELVDRIGGPRVWQGQ